MHYIRGVGITQPIICVDPPTREPLSPVLLVLRSLRMLVRHALAVGVVGENSQPTAQLMLVRCLQRVVAAGRVRCLVGSVAGKRGERNVILRIDADWQNLVRRVEVAKVVQMASRGTHVSDLDGVVVRELILDSQVEGLNVRGLEVILPPI